MTQPTTTDLHIRWLLRRDLSEVLWIESSTRDAWTEPELMEVLRQKNCIGLVAEYERCIVGFAVYELHANTLILRRIGVDNRCRRQGIGRQIVERIAGKLKPQSRRFLDATVSESNLEAQLFFQACGFVAVDMMRGEGLRGEDAYLMRYEERV